MSVRRLAGSQAGRRRTEREGRTDGVFDDELPPFLKPCWWIPPKTAVVLEDGSLVGRALPLELRTEGGRMGVDELQNGVGFPGRGGEVPPGRGRG